MPKKAKITKSQVEDTENEEMEEEEEAPKKPLNRQDMSEMDLKIRDSINPGFKFVAIELTGDDRWRIMSKTKQWVSPVLNRKEATILVTKLNLKDPEQKDINLPKAEKNSPIHFQTDSEKGEGKPRVVRTA